MLKIEFIDNTTVFKPYDETDIFDIETDFCTCKVIDNDVNRAIISEVEQGAYLDSTSFIDRFGYKLYNSELSTGCKAALLVANNPDKRVWLVETGLNAQDVVVKHCKDGLVVIPERIATFGIPDDADIDVEINGRRFKKALDLNRYIRNGL